jgi:hypothetical protein
MFDYLDGVFPTYTISGARLLAYGLVIYLLGYLIGKRGYDADKARAAKTDQPAPVTPADGDAAR